MAFEKMLKNLDIEKCKWKNAQDVMDWWISKSAKADCATDLYQDEKEEANKNEN